jgi:dihydrofolate reductase
MKIIVASCKNFGIGFKNKLPWKLKNELKYFKKLTIGNGNNAIIMGSNTWFSLPKSPLPNRFNCVLSTKLNINTHNTKTFSSKEKIIEFTNQQNFDDVWIIGGEKVYNSFVNDPIVDKIYITNILEDFECDTFFNLPNNSFVNVRRLQQIDKVENNINYKQCVYQRV